MTQTVKKIPNVRYLSVGRRLPFSATALPNVEEWLTFEMSGKFLPLIGRKVNVLFSFLPMRLYRHFFPIFASTIRKTNDHNSSNVYFVMDHKYVMLFPCYHICCRCKGSRTPCPYHVFCSYWVWVINRQIQFCTPFISWLSWPILLPVDVA